MKTKSGQAIPEELSAALAKNTGVLKSWNALRPSCQREYLKWVQEAKRPETRQRRIASVLKQTSEYAERLRKKPAMV
ncbi:MAG: YdeI/OmpD-associated family protein [Tepidisphaeraceae bacterium]|jgi:uncharacterized protein YdeI (YjbR/CyaY-like superfamily)